MADYKRKTRSDNSHLSSGTSAKWLHIDGNKPQVIPSATSASLLRVVIGTAGVVAVIRNGTEVVGAISSTAVGTLNYGVYCNNNITVDVVSGTGSLTVVYDN